MSKFEIGTEKLTEAINKASKGVGNIGIFVITSVIGLEGKDGNLTLTTTDNSTNLKVVVKDVLPTDLTFYTATDAGLLKALVNKTTSATIELDIQEDKIVFSGNCDANLPIVQNDEGTGPAKIRQIVVEGEGQTVKVADLKKFLRYLKGTLPTNSENPQYTAYRVGNNFAMTYDNFGSNLIEIEWNPGDILIPAPIVNLFDLLKDDNATITVAEGKIKIETSDVTITGSLRADVDKYPTERFTKIIYSQDMFNTEVTIDKSRFVDALDRISLFVTKDTDFRFTAEIDPQSILLLTNDRNYVEKVDFENSNSTISVQRIVGLATLKAAVSALTGDKVVVNFGENGGMRITEDKAYMVVPYARKIN